MAKTTSDSILGVIRKFELMLTRRAVNMLGGGLRSPSAFLVFTSKHAGWPLSGHDQIPQLFPDFPRHFEGT